MRTRRGSVRTKRRRVLGAKVSGEAGRGGKSHGSIPGRFLRLVVNVEHFSSRRDFRLPPCPRQNRDPR